MTAEDLLTGMQEFSDQQNKQLLEKIEELEKERNLMRTDAPEVWYRMEEQVNMIRQLRLDLSKCMEELEEYKNLYK